MAKRCDRCGRGALKGNSRSHSNIATIKHQQLNLQSKVIGGARLRICTGCLRSLHKVTNVPAKTA